MDLELTEIGYHEAVVAQLSISSSAVLWVLTSVIESSSIVSILPLIGVVWGISRTVERESPVEQVQQPIADGGSAGAKDREVREGIDEMHEKIEESGPEVESSDRDVRESVEKLDGGSA